MKKIFICLVPLLLLSAGCHYIAEQSRSLADRSISIGQLLETPDAYRGKFVLIGGVVTAVSRSGDETSLEVEEHRLDSRELPDKVIQSRGRFLAITPLSLDPAHYKPGALVSMMGEVVGTKVRTLEGTEHTYPVIAVREIHAIELPEIHPEYNYGGRGAHFDIR